MKAPTSLFALALLPQLLHARSLNVRDTVSCSYHSVAEDGDTCASFSEQWSLTVDDFKSLNPGVTCPKLVGGQSYCVVGSVTTGSATSTGPAKTATATKPSSTPNQPRQSDTAANCDKYHLVASGDSCDIVEKKYGVTEAQFYRWNPSVNEKCSNLLLGYYYCVHVPGADDPSKTTAGPDNTPTPHQTGMTKDCDKFYLVKQGDKCQAILDKYGLTLQTFFAWNPAVGKDCTALWVGEYYCVHKEGYQAPSKTQGNGIATPTPYEPVMVDNCNRFYYVEEDNTCATISKKVGVSVANIEKWNPKVGNDCSHLYLHNYICIGVR